MVRDIAMSSRVIPGFERGAGCVCDARGWDYCGAVP